MLKTQKVTAIPYEGKVSIHDRAIYQSVARAMQGNITMALIELMTNSNDSYGRIGIENGKIIISYKKSRFKCKFSVKDEAEGQSLADFYENFTKYWKPSDVTGDSSQRGYFGKGAKDALGYMDEGEIASFKEGSFILCTIFSDDKHVLRYKVLKDCKATTELRKKYGIKGNGTVASFVADPQSNKKIKVPQFNTLHEDLSNHYLLRKILQDKNVKVSLVNEKGRKKDKRHLTYVEPKGVEIHEESFNIKYGDYSPFLIDMGVSRSDTTLSQKDKGDTRQGGLLIVDEKGVVLDISLFRYDYDPLASKFFGEVVVNGFRRLLKDSEIVLSPERDGLVKNHPFVESLTKELTQRLDRLIQKEKERLQRFDVTSGGKEHQKRQRDFCNALNDIAAAELEWEDEPEDIKDLPYPLNGFYMYPESTQVSSDSHTVFTLRVDTKKVAPGTWIELKSTNPSFKIANKDNRLLVPSPKKSKKKGRTPDSDNIVVKHITVIGSKPHETGKIIAKAPDRTASSKLYITPPEDISEYGVAFQYDNVIAAPNKPRKVLMFASPKVIKTGDVIKLASDSSYIHINQEEIVVDSEEDMVRGVLRYELEIWGDGEGQEGGITATCDSHSGWECENIMGVQIRYKRPKKEKIRETIFSPPEYRTDPEPPQPASYSGEMERVFIYTKFPTVNHYIGRNLENMNSLPAQIYISNLVMERYFHQLAFKAIDNSGTILSERNKHDAIQRRANELMKKYGQELSKILVNQKLLKKSFKDQK